MKNVIFTSMKNRCMLHGQVFVKNCSSSLVCHYANKPMQYTAIFHSCKNDNFQMKNCDDFHIFCSNIDCGYMLEPPQCNEYPQSMF